MVFLYKLILLIVLISVFSTSYARPYNRDNFNYHSYKAYSAVGFYTEINCAAVDIDHIVSFSDAYHSGASDWSDFKKTIFANDRKNHVPACEYMRNLKADLTPAKFLQKGLEEQGEGFKIIPMCEYVSKYHDIKTKYSLSFGNNNKLTFADCGLAI